VPHKETLPDLTGMRYLEAILNLKVFIPNLYNKQEGVFPRKSIACTIQAHETETWSSQKIHKQRERAGCHTISFAINKNFTIAHQTKLSNNMGLNQTF
jgi:hypothetical protein